MNIFRKSIFIAASPNNQFDDTLQALKMVVRPKKWFENSTNKKFTQQLSEKTGIKNIQLVDSGRSALYSILKSQGIGIGDEVILPSFTCVVVANAVNWTGAKPIYLDTSKKDFNADYSSLKEKITAKTKAVIVQHTFGKMVDVNKVRQSVESNYSLPRLEKENSKLDPNRQSRPIIIEDFAHSLDLNMDLKGDFGFTTFGIEKVLSTVRGGAIFSSSDKKHKSVEEFVKTLPEIPKSRVFISLINPIFWWIAIPLHSLGIGRFTAGAFIRGIWRKLGFLGIMVEPQENRGKKPSWFPAKMAGALSYLGLKQIQKLEYYNRHRAKIAHIYDLYLGELTDGKIYEEFAKGENKSESGSQFARDKQDLKITSSKERVFLRYPILLKNKSDWHKVWNRARELRVTLGNWFAKPLYGSTVGEDTYKELCYVPASTPETLKKANLVLNLPTGVNISEKRAKELAIEIKKALANYD